MFKCNGRLLLRKRGGRDSDWYQLAKIYVTGDAGSLQGQSQTGADLAWQCKRVVSRLHNGGHLPCDSPPSQHQTFLSSKTSLSHPYESRTISCWQLLFAVWRKKSSQLWQPYRLRKAASFGAIWVVRPAKWRYADAIWPDSEKKGWPNDGNASEIHWWDVRVD